MSVSVSALYKVLCCDCVLGGSCVHQDSDAWRQGGAAARCDVLVPYRGAVLWLALGLLGHCACIKKQKLKSDAAAARCAVLPSAPGCCAWVHAGALCCILD